MRIHREGYQIIAGCGVGLLILNSILALLLKDSFVWIIALVSLIFFGFIISFFRSPHRQPPTLENVILAPADGHIVNIERVTENEYFHDERIMISIFMSVFNVHQNWIPCDGKISYARYHAGKYLVAFHPKSSELNERSTLVIETPTGVSILVRQIAGLLARRIITYSQPDQIVHTGEELGFIKFGSRVDVFVPIDSEIIIKLYQNVKGSETILAKL